MKKILFCGLILGLFVMSAGGAATCDEGYYVGANGDCVECPETAEFQGVVYPYTFSGEYLSGIAMGGGDSADKCRYATWFMFSLDDNTTLSANILFDVHGNVLDAVLHPLCRGDFYSRTHEWDYLMLLQAGIALFYDNPIENVKELVGMFVGYSDAGEQLAERLVANARHTGPMESIEAVKNINTGGLCIHKSNVDFPDGFVINSTDIGFGVGVVNIGMPCIFLHPLFTHSDGTRTELSDCFALTSPGQYFNANVDVGAIEVNECPVGYYCPGNVRFGQFFDEEIGDMNLKSTGHFACSALSGDHDVSPENATSAPGAINPTDCYVDMGGDGASVTDSTGTYISSGGMCYYTE